jgi:hypothetical protein
VKDEGQVLAIHGLDHAREFAFVSLRVPGVADCGKLERLRHAGPGLRHNRSGDKQKGRTTVLAS